MGGEVHDGDSMDPASFPVQAQVCAMDMAAWLSGVVVTAACAVKPVKLPPEHRCAPRTWRHGWLRRWLLQRNVHRNLLHCPPSAGVC
eukprot:1153119-Pelagomonas_calceolata.AAC.10